MLCVKDKEDRCGNTSPEEGDVVIRAIPNSAREKIGEAIVVRMTERNKNWGTRKKYRIFRKVGKNWK